MKSIFFLLCPKGKLQWCVFIIGFVLGAGAYWLVPSKGAASATSGRQDWFLAADGSFCATDLAAACVQPNGEVHIPSGAAEATIPAYFAIRPWMPGVAPSIDASWMYDTDDGDQTAYTTSEVRGRFSAAETLTRMLESSGLVIKMTEDSRGIAILPRYFAERE